LKTLVLALGLFSSAAVFARADDGFIGNGGDEARSYFLEQGERVLNYLSKTAVGKSVLQRHGLDRATLEAVLVEEVVLVVEGPLYDNRGSRVDAIGVPGRIELDGGVWFRYSELKAKRHRLVFHEMLRAAGIDDDENRISKSVEHLDWSYSANDPTFAEARARFRASVPVPADRLHNTEWVCTSVRYDGMKSAFGLAFWAQPEGEFTAAVSFESFGSVPDYDLYATDFRRVEEISESEQRLWIEQALWPSFEPKAPVSESAPALRVSRFIECVRRS
jgi:hypothetical protein